MDAFQYKNNELYCESVPVSKIVKKQGTPLYIYSYDSIVNNYKRLAKAFKPVKPLICFSMKSNTNLSVCRALLKAGSGFDIVSGGELFKALNIGANPKKIVYASVGKSPEEIAEAIEAGILFFNVESVPELEMINKISKMMKKKTRVALRMNPDVDAKTHSFTTTGKKENKFGMSPDDVLSVFSDAKSFSNLKIAGIHLHIGSQITSADPYVKAINKTIQIINKIKAKGGKLEYLNIGGGFGIKYKDEEVQAPEEFAKAILPLLKKTGLKIVLEPGRFIMGNSGILVTQVLYVKKTPVKTFVIIDAAMNDLIRPALYGSYHEIIPVNDSGSAAMVADIVGPVCESGDFLAKGRHIPEVEQGDCLAVKSAGAYGFVMASNYNSRVRPAEVMVFGDKFALVRKREEYKDLIKGEVIPANLK